MPRVRKSFMWEGKRYWACGPDEIEAEVKKRMMLAELEKGRIIKESGITLGEWTEKWLTTYKSQTVNDRTLRDLEYMLNKTLIPRFGKTPLKKIKPVQLQQFLNDLAAEGKSKSYLTKMKTSLDAIFDTALDNDLLNYSPVARITMPRVNEGHRRALTNEERTAFLSACDKCEMAGLWGKVLYYTGLRPAETSDIRGRDIQEINGRRVLHVKGTKTDAADRYVPLPEKLSLPRLKQDELLLHTTTGEPMTVTSRRRAWQRIVRQMNIEMGVQVGKRGVLIHPLKVADDLVPYCLRHNYATMLQEGGADIGVISAVMGHTSTATTSKVYTHLSMQTVLNAGVILDAYV